MDEETDNRDTWRELEICIRCHCFAMNNSKYCSSECSNKCLICGKDKMSYSSFCEDHKKGIDTCLYNNCTEETLGKYCHLHRCRICTSVCEERLCNNCRCIACKKNSIIVSSKYCKACVCVVCSSPRVKDSKYCIECKCCALNCPHVRITQSNYCKEHKCQKCTLGKYAVSATCKDCKKKENTNTNICQNCGTNERLKDSVFCSACKCIFCMNKKYTWTSLCINCKCANCGSERLKDSLYCLNCKCNRCHRLKTSINYCEYCICEECQEMAIVGDINACGVCLDCFCQGCYNRRLAGSNYCHECICIVCGGACEDNNTCPCTNCRKICQGCDCDEYEYPLCIECACSDCDETRAIKGLRYCINCITRHALGC